MNQWLDFKIEEKIDSKSEEFSFFIELLKSIKIRLLVGKDLELCYFAFLY